MAQETAGTKKQREQLRADLDDQGCTPEQIAAEMARQFGFRARQAWRHTHGWTQDELAAAYNRLLNNDQAPMTGKRISDYEAWPKGGIKPTTNTLAMLATIYSTRVSNLIDLDDRAALSTQELIVLDALGTHTAPPAAAPKWSHSPHAENNAKHPTTAGDQTTQSDPDTSATIVQPNHMPDQTPVQRRRWHLILTSLLAITAAISGAIITREIADSQPAMPAHTSSPSTPSSPTASMPPSAPPRPTVPPPPLPSAQAELTPPRPPAPSFSPAQPAPASPTPATQQVPPPTQPSPSPTQPPPSTEPPTAETASASTAAVTWKNMHYDMCLDEQEGDVNHDPANIQLWECNGSNNQIWAEKTIVANPTSIAKNLASSRTGKCITYQPGYYGNHAKVWLTPCGKDGQGWIRTGNGKIFSFEAAEVRGMCLSATSGLVTGGFTGIELRSCATTSPLKDWRLY